MKKEITVFYLDFYLDFFLFVCLIVIISTVFPSLKVQAVSSSLAFFPQQRLLLKDSPNQLFKLNTEEDLVIGT